MWGFTLLIKLSLIIVIETKLHVLDSIINGQEIEIHIIIWLFNLIHSECILELKKKKIKQMAVDGAGVFTVGKRKLLHGLVTKSFLMSMKEHHLRFSYVFFKKE